MKPLPLTKALKLYDILSKYVPEEYDPDDVFNFAGTIVKNIKNSGNHKDYLNALAIMLNKTVKEIIANSDPHEAIRLFIEGIIENQFPSLVEYCKKIGYQYVS